MWGGYLEYRVQSKDSCSDSLNCPSTIVVILWHLKRTGVPVLGDIYTSHSLWVRVTFSLHGLWLQVRLGKLLTQIYIGILGNSFGPWLRIYYVCRIILLPKGRSWMDNDFIFLKNSELVNNLIKSLLFGQNRRWKDKVRMFELCTHTMFLYQFYIVHV